jgi:hypothetical protein
MSNTHNRPATGLRVLDYLLKAGSFLLTIVTVLAVPLLILALTGRGTVSVSGTLDAPFAVDLDDGRRVAVAGEMLSYENFEIGNERSSLQSPPTIETQIQIQRDDLDTRIVVTTIVISWLVIAWIGLRELQAVVRSTLGGHPFGEANPARLRRLGIAVLLVPAIAFVAQPILNATIDSDLPFTVRLDTSNWWTLIIVGLGVLAAAEIFAEGARLRAFEEATI